MRTRLSVEIIGTLPVLFVISLQSVFYQVLGHSGFIAEKVCIHRDMSCDSCCAGFSNKWYPVWLCSVCMVYYFTADATRTTGETEYSYQYISS